MGSIITRFAETAALLLMPVMTALAQIEEVATTDSIGIGRVRLGNANLACNFQRLAWLNRRSVPAWPGNAPEGVGGRRKRQKQATKPAQ